MAGINKFLYDKKNTEPESTLTRQEVMEKLHIKDGRVFIRLIKDEGLPYCMINGKYLVLTSSFNEWLKKKERIN